MQLFANGESLQSSNASLINSYGNEEATATQSPSNKKPAIEPPGGTRSTSTMQVSNDLKNLLDLSTNTYDLNNPLGMFRSCRDTVLANKTSNAPATPSTPNAAAAPLASLSNEELLGELTKEGLDPNIDATGARMNGLLSSMTNALIQGQRPQDATKLVRAFGHLSSYFDILRVRIFQADREFANRGQFNWRSDLYEAARRAAPGLFESALNNQPVAAFAFSREVLMTEAAKVRLEREQAVIHEAERTRVCAGLAHERQQIANTHAFYAKYPNQAELNSSDWWWLKRGKVYFKTLEDAFNFAPRGELSIMNRKSCRGGVGVVKEKWTERGRTAEAGPLFDRNLGCTNQRFVRVDYGPASLLREVVVRFPTGAQTVYLGDQDYVVGNGEPTSYPPTQWVSPTTLWLNGRYLNCAVLSAFGH